ncbi:MAG TPA: gluconokinase, partial [Chitinophagaceae bacterium]|nr:gluconokinase [Chitinophagaceae bacterium]
MNRIIYIMGVSGSGKTTIGNLLSKKTGIPFFDADDFHPEQNKEKMKAGQPLDDEDRKDWLK